MRGANLRKPAPKTKKLRSSCQPSALPELICRPSSSASSQQRGDNHSRPVSGKRVAGGGERILTPNSVRAHLQNTYPQGNAHSNGHSHYVSMETGHYVSMETGHYVSMETGHYVSMETASQSDSFSSLAASSDRGVGSRSSSRPSTAQTALSSERMRTTQSALAALEDLVSNRSSDEDEGQYINHDFDIPEPGDWRNDISVIEDTAERDATYRKSRQKQLVGYGINQQIRDQKAYIDSLELQLVASKQTMRQCHDDLEACLRDNEDLRAANASLTKMLRLSRSNQPDYETNPTVEPPPKILPPLLEELGSQAEYRRLAEMINDAVLSYKSLDHVKVIEEIVRLSCKVVNSDRGALFILDSESQEFWSFAGPKGAEIRFPMSAGVVGFCALARDVVNIEDAYSDIRFNNTVDKITGYRTVAILAVPVYSDDGKVVGVLEAINKIGNLNYFDKNDERLLELMARHTSLCLQHANHYRDTVHRETCMRRMLDVAMYMLGPWAAEELYGFVTLKSREIVRAKHALLYLLDPMISTLVEVAHEIEPGETIVTHPPLTYPLNVGLIGRLGQSGIVANLTHLDERWNPELDAIPGVTPKNMLCTPIVWNKRVVGIIQVVNRAFGIFGLEDQRHMEIYASVLAPILSSCVDELQERHAKEHRDAVQKAQDVAADRVEESMRVLNKLGFLSGGGSSQKPAAATAPLNMPEGGAAAVAEAHHSDSDT